MILDTILIKIERKEKRPIFVKMDKYQFHDFLHEFERIDSTMILVNKGANTAFSKYDIERILIYNQEGVKQLLVDHLRLRIVDSNNQRVKAEI